jgi:thioredoxin-related protein
MVKLLFLCFFSFVTADNPWLTNMNEAKTISVKNNRPILLNFSGSDWCGPCVRLHKEIFDNEVFKVFAYDNLVLVNADFPRQKKNQLSKEQQKQNDQLADMYNKEGKFPYTVLLSPDGKILRDWDGNPKDGVASFIEDIKPYIGVHN